MKKKGITGILAFLILGSSALAVAAENTTAVVNPQNIGLLDAGFGIYKYDNSDALIKAVKLLEKFGYNTSVVSETLDLNVYRGSVIVFGPDANAKALSAEDAMAALRYNMRQINISSQESLVIRNTPTSVSEGGTVITQSYEIFYNGQHPKGTQQFMVPSKGLALTIVKLDDDRLLAIITKP